MSYEPTLNEELLELTDATFINWTCVSGLPIPFDGSDCDVYHCYITQNNEFKFALAEVKGELRFAFGRDAGKEKTAPLPTNDKIAFLRTIKEYYLPLISYCPDYFNPIKGEAGRLSKLWNYVLECNNVDTDGCVYNSWIPTRIGEFDISVSRNMIGDDEGKYFAEILDNNTGDIVRINDPDPIHIARKAQDELRKYHYATMRDSELMVYSSLPYECPAYTPPFLKKFLKKPSDEDKSSL